MANMTERAFSARVFTERDGYRAPAVIESAAGFFALAFAAPLMRERLAAEISAEYSAGDGPTAEAHKQMLAKLDAELLELEMAEEALLRAAEAAGIEILRRIDADPRAVLAADSALPA
ncbi:hypothetical protein EN851_03535 [Mesorhizobium sp. M8A.F.Ca.ET.208.01.1.1]|uniref:hypothetical protein n=1 Tax=unclassified Mesorhizobium TaxID=325217 RepID=UPI001093F963|nr:MULTISPECIES: hypothetical protein [unclassified Mesorhizobium]TGQ94637.1 hypothetical protein EN851_03535 [Mesorhizobium sp. M8A.F.Ca.ET.208.01.1.1]TGT55124.1 hypothetical protein EN810_03535 [Mesorhizobium sp. M8A.F.Ca.ET.167.01.1.1]